MKLDDEKQREALLNIIDGTSFTISGADIEEASETIINLKIAIKNARFERQKGDKDNE